MISDTWDVLNSNPIRYFARRGGSIAGGAARSRRGLIEAVNNLPDFNVYVTLNPTVPQIPSVKAASRDVTEWRWVLVDIDPLGPQFDSTHIAHACHLLSDLHPSFLRVSSGRGLQLWLSVTPLRITPSNRSVIERSTRAFLHTLGRRLDGFPGKVDTSCSDLCRVARMPGTINLKTGVRSHFIDLATDLHMLYPFDHEKILALNPRDDLGPPPGPITTRVKSKILPMLPATASTFLTEGVMEPGRHSACYATSRALLEVGIDDDQARSWVIAGAQLCQPPLRVDDAVRAFDNARRKHEDHH